MEELDYKKYFPLLPETTIKKIMNSDDTLHQRLERMFYTSKRVLYASLELNDDSKADPKCAISLGEFY